jgi:hypothetical protein
MKINLNKKKPNEKFIRVEAHKKFLYENRKFKAHLEREVNIQYEELKFIKSNWKDAKVKLIAKLGLVPGILDCGVSQEDIEDWLYFKPKLKVTKFPKITNDKELFEDDYYSRRPSRLEDARDSMSNSMNSFGYERHIRRDGNPPVEIPRNPRFSPQENLKRDSKSDHLVPAEEFPIKDGFLQIFYELLTNKDILGVNPPSCINRNKPIHGPYLSNQPIMADEPKGFFYTMEQTEPSKSQNPPFFYWENSDNTKPKPVLGYKNVSSENDGKFRGLNLDHKIAKLALYSEGQYTQWILSGWGRKFHVEPWKEFENTQMN